MLHDVKGVQKAVLASARNIVLLSALSFEFFQALLVHFLFVDRHLRSDAAILHSSTLVLPQSVADLNRKCAVSRKRFICGPMLTETFLLILVCSFHP
jgi:hypothetical protein